MKTFHFRSGPKSIISDLFHVAAGIRYLPLFIGIISGMPCPVSPEVSPDPFFSTVSFYDRIYNRTIV